MPKNQSLAAAVKARQHLTVTNFFGGLNEDPNFAAVDDNEFSFLENMYWKGRTLASRPGTERHNITHANNGSACTGLFDFTRSAGSASDFVGIFGDKIYKDVASVWTDITGSVTITAGQNNVFTGAVFKNVLIVTNGVDAPIKWTGTGNAAALGGSPPTSPYVCAKWGRLFMAPTSDRGIIQYSAVNDHESWAAGDQLRIFVAGEEWITGLASWKDFLLVLTNKQIYPVTANEGEGVYLQPFNVDKNKPIQSGVAHQRAFVTIGNDAVFMDWHGQIRSLGATTQYGNLEEAALSRKIAPRTLKSLNLSRVTRAVAAYLPTEDWIVFAVSIGTLTTNTLLLVLDLKDTSLFLDPVRAKPKWTRFTGLSANAFVTRTVSRTQYLYFGGYTGFVSRFNDTVLNDAADVAGASRWDTALWDTALWDSGVATGGQPFAKIAKTKWFDFGSPHMVKSLRTFAVEAEKNNSTLTINHYFDYNEAATGAVSLSLAAGSTDSRFDEAVFGTSVWGGTGIIAGDWRTTGRGFVIRTEFKNVNANERFGILRYDYGVMEIGER